jgi:hypothetical protein
MRAGSGTWTIWNVQCAKCHGKKKCPGSEAPPPPPPQKKANKTKTKNNNSGCVSSQEGQVRTQDFPHNSNAASPCDTGRGSPSRLDQVSLAQRCGVDVDAASQQRWP